MKMLRKGQAALEFLTTYGWAFLVILVMIGALAYFGVLDVGRLVPENCKLDGNLECSSYAVKETGIAMTIDNNLQDDVKITKIVVQEKDSDKKCTLTVSANNEIPKSSDGTIADTAVGSEGEPLDFDDVTVGGVAAPCDLSNGANNLEGEKKRFNVEVYYQKRTSGADYSNIENLASGSMTAVVRS